MISERLNEVIVRTTHEEKVDFIKKATACHFGKKLFFLKALRGDEFREFPDEAMFNISTQIRRIQRSIMDLGLHNAEFSYGRAMEYNRELESVICDLIDIGILGYYNEEVI